MKKSRKIIVISAHPDDETLGVGGSLLKHKSYGDELYWIIVTNVSTEHGFTSDKSTISKNELLSIKAQTETYLFEETESVFDKTLTMALDNEFTGDPAYVLKKANKNDIIVMLGKAGQDKMYYDGETVEYIEKNVVLNIIGKEKNE